MRSFLLAALLLPAFGLAVHGQEAPTAGIEVFTGSEDAVRPRERPSTPVTTYWRVQLGVKIADVPAQARAQVLLPLSGRRQQILERNVEMRRLLYDETPTPPNLVGSWTAAAAAAEARFVYEMNVAVSDTWETIPRIRVGDLKIPRRQRVYLEPSSLVQSKNSEIRRRARDLIKDALTVEDVLWSLFQYTAAFVRARKGAAKEDALTVLRAESGSNTGKARLLTALLRSVGVPARLVGGLKLRDSAKKRATISWVEAHIGGTWIPLDPGGGHFAWLPNDYLTLYRGDLPLIVHTAGLNLSYDFIMRATSRGVVEGPPAPTPDVPRGEAETGSVAESVRTAASYVERPVASVVVFADQGVPQAVIDRVLDEAQQQEIDVVILHARFESGYFRKQYLQRLINNNIGLLRRAHALLVVTQDDTGLYALTTMADKEISLEDKRIVVSGQFPRPVGRVFGSLLYRLFEPGEIVLFNHAADLLPMWAIIRANVVDGVPMVEESHKWGLKPLLVNRLLYEELNPWRKLIVGSWARAVRVQVPLQALTLILVLPVIAALIVVVRTLIGVETFGVFSPVIVSLAFLTTGLRWGTAIFAMIVGIGAFVRALLQRVRLQLVARLAILIAVVAGVMAVLTVIGGGFGIGALINISIFPMVIMSNVIENFATSQAEFGTREAVRLTVNTLVIAALCYLAIEETGLQSLLLAFPELLVVAIVCDIALGKWRGLRALEYLRFFDLGRRTDRWVP
jgi:transglutaminase-like putative cysteine protease